MSRKKKSAFLKRLQLFGFADYNEYLASEVWASFRNRYFERYVNRCTVCGEVGTQLHHKTYERVCEESFDDVIPLCFLHHSQVHAVLSENDWPVTKSEKAVSIVRDNFTGKKLRVVPVWRGARQRKGSRRGKVTKHRSDTPSTWWRKYR